MHLHLTLAPAVHLVICSLSFCNVHMDSVKALGEFYCKISVYIFLVLLSLFYIVSYIKHLLLLKLLPHLFFAV